MTTSLPEILTALAIKIHESLFNLRPNECNNTCSIFFELNIPGIGSSTLRQRIAEDGKICACILVKTEENPEINHFFGPGEIPPECKLDIAVALRDSNPKLIEKPQNPGLN